MTGVTQVSWRGLVPLGGAVLLFSSAWPVTKEAIGQGAAPIWFALGRTGLSALVTFVLMLAMRRLVLPTRRDMPFFLAVALCQLALFFICVHLALVWVHAGRTSVITSATILFTVPASVFVLGDSVPWRRWVAVALGGAGIVLLIGPWSIDWMAPGVLVGHLFLLTAAGAIGVPMLVIRLRPPSLSMVQMLPWAFGLASFLLLPLALLMEPPGRWGMPSVMALVYVGGVAGPIGTWCYLLTMIHLPVVVASVGLLMTPAVGLILSTIWLDEPLGLDLVIGAALILGGVGFFGHAGAKGMKLHAISRGDGPALVLLHGLFGQAGNFGAIQRRLAEGGRRVVAIDLRNHGASPHALGMDYRTMAADVRETMESLGLLPCAVLGHSMGGKTAMALALAYPDAVTRLCVADIAPVRYDPHLVTYAHAMRDLALTSALTRAGADAALAPVVADDGERAFLLSNLRLGAAPHWRIGLNEIIAGMEDIQAWPMMTGLAYGGPTLFLTGARSRYVQAEHRPAITALFPTARFVTLKNAGHWLHADDPEGFLAVLEAFVAVP